MSIMLKDLSNFSILIQDIGGAVKLSRINNSAADNTILDGLISPVH
ncbi:MAG: hypothetical protein PVF53_17905 [Desulfobacterales bacterium]|jgi:hypothetical protein